MKTKAEEPAETKDAQVAEDLLAATLNQEAKDVLAVLVNSAETERDAVLKEVLMLQDQDVPAQANHPDQIEKTDVPQVISNQ